MAQERRDAPEAAPGARASSDVAAAVASRDVPVQRLNRALCTMQRRRCLLAASAVGAPRSAALFFAHLAFLDTNPCSLLSRLLRLTHADL